MKKNKIIKRGQNGQDGGGEHRDREEDFIFFNFSSLRLFFRSTKIKPQVFVGTEGKVDLRNESYAWTPKNWSFDKLREVGVLFYLKLHFV